MVKVIVHITKAVIAVVLSLLCLSCGFDFRTVDGTGNVATKQRTVQETFTSVSASGGLDVVIEQGNQQSVTVEADENLHEHIKTEVKDGELRISSDANIGNGTKTITVVLPTIESITSEASAAITSKNSFKGDSMKLSSSSGSSIEVSLTGRNVACETSSGSSIEVAGQTENLETNCSSGGSINAKGLKAVNVRCDASSGGEITVNPTKNLTADASSGGSVHYLNTPSQIKKKSSSGGVVSQL